MRQRVNIMGIKLKIDSIMKPSGIALFAVLLSCCAWLCPDFGVLRKGFTVPEQPGLLAYFILISWYLLIFASFSIGQKLGSSFAGRSGTHNIPSLDSDAVYRTFTILAALGTISALFRIFSTVSIPQAAIYFYLGQGNRLKNSLYENYSAGLFSLRYLVLYSASLAIYRTVRFRKLSFLNVWNIFLLAMTVIVSSRLILIATLLVSFFLVNSQKSFLKISIIKLAVFAGTLFGILSLLNSSRNANFYAARDQSFAEAGISEIITYLGAPFHVSIGATRRLDEITVRGPESYREFIDIETALTTNSAFVHLHEKIGYFCWPYIAVVCCFMGFVFSWLASFGRTSLLLPCGAILYGAAELWRLDLFHQGIFVVWFLCGIGIPSAFLLFGKRRLPAHSTHGSSQLLQHGG